jgi:hypothetical protein
MRSKLISALAAVSLMAAPTMAVAQNDPDVETEEERRGGGFGQVLPLLVIIAIVFLIREIVKDRDIGAEPISP